MNNFLELLNEISDNKSVIIRYDGCNVEKVLQFCKTLPNSVDLSFIVVDDSGYEADQIFPAKYENGSIIIDSKYDDNWILYNTNMIEIQIPIKEFVSMVNKIK